MNLTDLKAKISARKRETVSGDGDLKHLPEITEAKVTPNQEKVLLKTLRSGNSSYYHFIVHFEGLLDERNLISAINKVIQNQLALRTSFFKRENDWYQRLVSFSEIEIKLTDLSEISESERQKETLKISGNLAEIPLNVIDGELFRMHLVRMSETNHLLIVVISHLCCDFISLAILKREVVTNYMEISSGGSPSADKSKSVNYLDYCKWIENKFTEKKIAEKKEFWGNYLKTAKPLSLGEKPDGDDFIEDTKIAAHEFLNIPPELKEKIAELRTEHSYSLTVISLAVFVLTLYFQTGQNGFIIGTSISGREKPEIENLIGYFSNLLVFNIDINLENTFFGFLEQVRNNILECYKHQDTPYAFIESAAPEIFAKENSSLVETVFSVNSVSQNQFDILGMKIWMEMIDTFQTAFDLTFLIYSDSELFISTEYRKSVFSNAAIKDLQAAYLNMLKLFTENPDVPVGKFLLNN